MHHWFYIIAIEYVITCILFFAYRDESFQIYSQPKYTYKLFINQIECFFYAVECYYVLYLVAQSCLILCNLMDYSPPDSSVHGDSTGKNTGVVAMPSSRKYSQIRD